MGTAAGAGYSVRRNPAEAGREAALKAKQQAWTEAPYFIFVFATVGYSQQVLIRSKREATSREPLSGCSGEGIITHGIVDKTNFGVSVMVIRSDDLRFHNSCVLDIQQGADVAKTCLAAKKHKGELQVQSEVGNGTTFAISIPNSKGVNIFSRFS